MMADEEKYVRLKALVIKTIGDTCDLAVLKKSFKADIDSIRTYKQIKSVSDLITVLEKRDILNYESPMALFHIGEILRNEDVKFKVKVYKDIYLSNHLASCACGKALDYSPTTTDDMLRSEGNSFKTNSTNSDLMDAIKILSERLKWWRVLASELNLEEYIIDEIYKKHPKDKKMQAYEALKYWIQREKENATIENLDKALDARLCRVKGLGSHLRKPLAHLS